MSLTSFGIIQSPFRLFRPVKIGLGPYDHLWRTQNDGRILKSCSETYGSLMESEVRRRGRGKLCTLVLCGVCPVHVEERHKMVNFINYLLFKTKKTKAPNTLNSEILNMWD